MKKILLLLLVVLTLSNCRKEEVNPDDTNKYLGKWLTIDSYNPNHLHGFITFEESTITCVKLTCKGGATGTYPYKLDNDELYLKWYDGVTDDYRKVGLLSIDGTKLTIYSVRYWDTGEVEYDYYQIFEK